MHDCDHEQTKAEDVQNPTDATRRRWDAPKLTEWSYRITAGGSGAKTDGGAGTHS